MREIYCIIYPLIFFAVLIPFDAHPQTESEDSGYEKEEARNELAVFLGVTTNEDATAFTFGLDYQYRISPIVGIGALVDHAAGDIKSTLVGPALLLHFRKWEFTLAPAAEFLEDETVAAVRFGLEYEIKLPKFSISPAVNVDFERSGSPAAVYGLAFSKEF